MNNQKIIIIIGLIISFFILEKKAYAADSCLIEQYTCSAITQLTSARSYYNGYTYNYETNTYQNDSYIMHYPPDLRKYCNSNMFSCTDGVCTYYRGTGKEVVSTFTPGGNNVANYSTPPSGSAANCPIPCQQEKEEMIFQCGGESNLINWSDETCTGECDRKCDQVGQEDYGAALARCTFQEKTLMKYDFEICEGICGCTELEISDGYASCEPYKVIGFNDITCQAICGICEDKESEADAVCGRLYAVAWDCDENGNVTNVQCSNEAPPDNPTAEPNPTPEPNDPEEPEADPADDPESPINDPEAPDSEKGNAYLAAIKGDTGKLVKIGNKANEYLDNISENVAVITKNQKAINDSIQDGTRRTVDSINGLKGSIDAVKDAINDLPDESTPATGMPSVPEYDTGLDPSKNYTEYDDSGQLASDKATADYVAPTTGQSPYTGAITATGDACINGVIHGHAVQACFDHPWMLQGYAIMKICLIALGYIQTAILLNKAIIG